EGIDFELVMKSMDLFKGGKQLRSVIGHTSTGKPVHADTGKDAPYHTSFTAEEHEEAGELHSAIANKLGAACDRYNTASYNSVPLGAAARKHLAHIRDHHNLMANGHRKAQVKKK